MTKIIEKLCNLIIITNGMLDFILIEDLIKEFVNFDISVYKIKIYYIYIYF
jgi:hypothetical protein